MSRAEWSGRRIETLDAATDEQMAQLRAVITKLAPTFDFSRDATKARLKAFPRLQELLDRHTNQSKYMFQWMKEPVPMPALRLDPAKVPLDPQVRAQAGGALASTLSRPLVASASASHCPTASTPEPEGRGTLGWVPLPVPVDALDPELKAGLDDRTIQDEKVYVPFELARKYAPNGKFAPSLLQAQKKAAPASSARAECVRASISCGLCSKPRAVTCTESFVRVQTQVRCDAGKYGHHNT